MGRGDLTGAKWERLRLFLPVSSGRRGRWRDHRQVIDGILHRAWTGVHWRDLPERFRPWKTVYERHRPWSVDSTWERLLEQVQATADVAGEIGWDIRWTPPSCEPISTRPVAAQACAGPCFKGAETPEHQGETPWQSLRADGRCRPLFLVVTPGQRADSSQFQTVLKKIRVPRVGPARSPTASRPTRYSATARTAHACGPEASDTRSRRRPAAGPVTYPKAHAADGHPASINSGTRSTTPSNERSTD
ncbi:IS5 family transposase (plasmid) [Streptomyces sp. AHU1]|uniref:IS5 family transposase n=1 Tax=Streptomyces sp. AHU1 TaxID=3377215 RepID=UPI003877A093